MNTRPIYSVVVAMMLASLLPVSGQLRIPPTLQDELTSSQIGEGTRNLVICIHGWNNPPVANRYEDTGEWAFLVSQLKPVLQSNSSDRWSLLLYHWEDDANTGGLGFPLVSINAVQAAMNSATHGISLGPRLPASLRRVHFITHSAGAWCAYRTAYSLMQLNPYVIVEITLLDPFMPNETPQFSGQYPDYSKAAISDMKNWSTSSRFYLLENYFANDLLPGLLSDAPQSWLPVTTVGTQETFSWRPGDVNLQVDWDPDFFTLGVNRYYDWHSGPTLFYGDTIAAADLGSVSSRLLPSSPPYIYQGYGWFRSLFHRTEPQWASLPIITTQPQNKTVVSGASVTLSVQGSSILSLNYQWFKRGQANQISGATAASYTFPASAATAGQYVVRVSDSTGTFFCDFATVTVTDAPTGPTGPSIASLSPAQLLPLASAQAQTLRIFGSGFTASSTLVFTHGASVFNSVPARLTYVSANELDYEIIVAGATGDWTAKVVNGAQESGLATFTVNTPQPNTGSLTINLSPSGAVSAGAQWRVDGGSYRNTGDTATGLTPGSHTVSFKSVSGYTTPADKSVSITSGVNTTDSGTYSAFTPTVATPSVSPNGGSFLSPQQVFLACGTPDASIRYSLNGIDPTESSPAYTSPFTVSVTTTVRARAFKAGYNFSDVASAQFNMTFADTVDAPVFSPNGGSFGQPASVYIGCGTFGAAIYYTLDGSDPVPLISQQFSGDFILNQSAAVNARAYKDGYNASPIVAATYTVSGQNNDLFANRIPITGASGRANGSNLQASKEPGEPKIFRSDRGNSDNSGGKSVWWIWRAPYSGTVAFDTIGSRFDTLLGVFTGTMVTSLTSVTGADDGGDQFATSLVSFQVVQGKDYAVVVDGYHSAFYNDIPNYTASGNVVLNWQMLTPPPTPDTATDFRWARKAGGGGGTASGDNRGYGIASDPSGNVFVAGCYLGNAVFSGLTLTNAGVEDAFLAKYDAGGGLLWVRRFGGSGADLAWSVATDSESNCFVLGEFRGVAGFGSTNLTALGGRDAFVAKFESDGTCAWVSQIGGSVSPRRIAVSGSNVYVSGEFLDTSHFGAEALTSGGLEDIFLAKYQSDGSLAWVRQINGQRREQAFGLAVDTSGNAFITGVFHTFTLSVGAFTLQRSNGGGGDFLLVKYDANGSVVWATRQGGDGADKGLAITVHPSGNLYVVGSFQDSSTYGPITFISAGDWDMFLAKFDSGGNLLWTRQSGGIRRDEPFDIGTDAIGNLYVAGVFDGTRISKGPSSIAPGARTCSSRNLPKMATSFG